MRDKYTATEREGCVTLNRYDSVANKGTQLLVTMVNPKDDPQGYTVAEQCVKYLAEMLNNPQLDARWHPEDEELDEEFSWVGEDNFDFDD